MKKFVVFISLYSAALWGMEKENLNRRLSVVYDDCSLKPDKVVTIFDPKKELEIHRRWCDVIPGSIMITPDDKGVVIGRHGGQVLYSSFDKADDRDPEIIIKHPEAKDSAPMIAMAQKRDGSLLIVSAGNYINSEKKEVAEYIMYFNTYGFSKPQNLDWSIQAIALDSAGETLAIAGLNSVMVIDCATNKNDMATYRKKFRSDSFIIDIAMNPKGGAIVAVGNQSQEAIQWMLLDKNKNDIDLKNIKQVDSYDNIEKIYYPSLEELFYLTRDGKAKIVDMYDLLDNNGRDLKTIPFVDSSVYDMVVGDLSEHIATAHWTNNVRLSENIRKKIEIYRKDKNNKCIDKFVLEVPGLEERYLYITSKSQRASGIGHLLDVALRARHVVALASDGKMRVWELPEKNAIYEQLDKKVEYEQKVAEEKLMKLEAATRHIADTRRKRSSSGNSGNRSIAISAPVITSEVTEKKKSPRVSPRMIDLIRSPKSSRENSPSRNSPINSAVNSPAKEKDTLKHSPRSESAPEMKLKDSNEKI